MIVSSMPLILVTNDDGVQSDGIHALADARSQRRCYRSTVAVW